MNKRLTTRQSPRWRWQAGVGLLLIGLVVVTWGLKKWQVARERSRAQAEREEAARHALDYIENDFTAFEQLVRRRAQSLATNPVVMSGMQVFLDKSAAPSQRAAPEKLITYFAHLEDRARESVELYDPIPRLVTWHGLGMPLDEAPNTERFLQAPQTAIVQDGRRREALAVWWPVRDSAQEVLGVVRVLKTIRFRPPVDNQYLQTYSLADRWRQKTGLDVQVRLGEKKKKPESGLTRRLSSFTGASLGTVNVQPASPEQLVQAVEARYDNVLAFWATLLLFWLLSLVWDWYARGHRFRRVGDSLHQRLQRIVLRLSGVLVAGVIARYMLLALDVPGRWQSGKAPLAPLFDPTHLASTMGSGLFRSTGDLLVTALFAAWLGGVVLHAAWPFREKSRQLSRLWDRLTQQPLRLPSLFRSLTIALGASVLVGGIGYALTEIARRIFLDSKLHFFVREDLVPGPLVLVVFCALLLISIAAVSIVVGGGWFCAWFLMRYRPERWTPRQLAVRSGAFLVGLIVVLYGFMLRDKVPIIALCAFIGIGGVLILSGFLPRWRITRLLTLRNVLSGIFLLTVMLYPILNAGMDVKRRLRMKYVAASFADQKDPRVSFALRRVLQKTQARLALQQPVQMKRARRDSLASELLRGSLLSSLSLYDISLTLFRPDGRPIGRSLLAMGGAGARNQHADSTEFDLIRQMYEESGASRPLVQQITGRRQRDRFQYVGVMPLYTTKRRDGSPAAWVMVRAEPQTPLHERGNPFPRVLLPSGLTPSPYADLSLATFRERTLVRSFGQDFGRYRLDQSVKQQLLTQPSLWRVEDVKDQRYLTLYQRKPSRSGALAKTAPQTSRVVAVRMPALSTFDHLYFLLRLTVAGLLIGIPVFLWGLYERYRTGDLPARRIFFRDKILNAFLGVGLVTVMAVGFVGLQVVRGANERATQSWLRQYLERVEETLVQESTSDEMPYRVLDRVRIDSLAAQIGLDLNLYTRARLLSTSRPQLVRENLIDQRLPIEAVQALFYEGYRYTFVKEKVGTFTYTTGFRALLDEEGNPRYVVAVPTLPDQERIEEERARTVAYLFGALLLLLIVVMLTAAIIARALTRPLMRLRSGLKAVAEGRFEQPIPVSTRDEIGKLVETFNAMQEQLAESRRKLARQERQLAWREMARQVAHEIKNPLTPMKLSVQHLQRAFKQARSDQEDSDEESNFRSFFERVTSTLISQIDTLARIANEFHSFARMPKKTPEALDLNEVIQDAITLMREEEGAANIEKELAVDAPLIVQADREELRRIYINLIKNAIQAIPEEQEGHIQVITRREVEDESSWALSRVTDNGRGILDEVREKIFEPNFSTKTSGTGLGLAIASKGIADIGGDIYFETEEGKGTSFFIRLPLVKEETPE